MSAENIPTFQARRKDSMYIRAAGLVLGAASIFTLTGCWASAQPPAYLAVTYSVEADTWVPWILLDFNYPFYFESDVIFLPELLGTWNHDQKNIGVIFEVWDERSYRITFTGKNTGKYGAAGARGRLVRLEDELFLTMADDPIPGTHDVQLIGRIRIEGGVLRMATPLPCPGKCKHEILVTDPKFKMRVIPIAGSKEELRRHLIENADEYSSFEEGDVLRRVSPPQADLHEISEFDSIGGEL